MDNLKEIILEYVNDIKYQPLTIIELYNELKLDIELDEFNNIILDLINSYDLFFNKKKDKILSSRLSGKYKGTITIKNPDYGFINNPYYPDFYVSSEDMLDSMNGDYCLYKIIDDYGKGDQATILEVLKRKTEYLVGEVRFFRGKYYLYTSKKNISNDILIVDIGKAKNKDIVRCKILQYGYFLKVEVCDILGDTNTIGIDILSVLSEYGINQEFPNEVINEANELEYNQIDNIYNVYRKRFENNIYTIDSESAKDLDDAVSIKKLNDGTYELGVYIADVSYYVKENSLIDLEALKRGTSIYLTDRVVPMLPFKLSNDLCSLNPNEDKLVIALIMKVDCNGNVVDSNFYEGIINTTKRLSYSKCNDVLEYGLINNPDYDICIDDIKLMYELSLILNEKRYSRGALNFDTEEIDFVLNDKGKPIEINLVKRGKSEAIIEEFMILANETVASFIENLDLPFIYRVHDKPDNIKFLNLKNTVNSLGYKCNSTHPKELQKLLDSINDEDNYLKNYIMRTMNKAIYSENNIGHFGLASDSYTHFTSPIRRYPDLTVHRLIRKYLFNNDINLSFDEAVILNEKIASIAKISSDNEKVATDIEFKVNDMKKAEYMESFIGNVYEGNIVSIHKFGIFVNIGLTIEGLVSSRILHSNYFEYDSVNNSYFNTLNKKELKVGSKLKVKLLDTNRKNGEINFDLVYNIYKGVRYYGKNKNRFKK